MFKCKGKKKNTKNMFIGYKIGKAPKNMHIIFLECAKNSISLHKNLINVYLHLWKILRVLMLV